METRSVAYFRQGLGNFVEFTPALQAIASMDPSGKVDLCTNQVWGDHRRDGVVSLAELLPFVNNIVNIETFDQKKYSTWFWTPWTCIGEDDLFKKKKPYDTPKWNQGQRHESDYYMDIARNFYGYKGEKPRQEVVPAKGPTIAKQGRKLVVLCNGGFAQLSVFKRWEGFKTFSPVVKSFCPDVAVAGIGSAQELRGVPLDLDYVGKLTMAQTAKVISQADLLVTTDTGNMHVADALGIPMIVLWGGAILAKNRPYEAPNVVVNLGLKCQPCINRVAYRFCKDFRCIRSIEVGEVMFYTRNFFKKGAFE